MSTEPLDSRNHGKPIEQCTERPCVDCGEPTLNDRRCRDCDIEWLFEMSSCRECDRFIKREDLFGPLEKQHAPGCSLATSNEWRKPWRD